MDRLSNMLVNCGKNSMPKTPSRIENLRGDLSQAWGKAVEKLRIVFGQTRYLDTSSTTGLLEISQTTTLARILAAVCPQVGWFFAHTILAFSSLLGGPLCSLSTNPIDTNELKKGFIV